MRIRDEEKRKKVESFCKDIKEREVGKHKINEGKRSEREKVQYRSR